LGIRIQNFLLSWCRGDSIENTKKLYNTPFAGARTGSMQDRPSRAKISLALTAGSIRKQPIHQSVPGRGSTHHTVLQGAGHGAEWRQRRGRRDHHHHPAGDEPPPHPVGAQRQGGGEGGMGAVAAGGPRCRVRDAVRPARPCLRRPHRHRPEPLLHRGLHP
jgi:hypothetical protein